MADETYNGWTNKATWLVKLWIDNEQYEQERWLLSAQDCRANATQSDYWTEEQAATYALSAQLQEQFEEDGGELTGVNGFWADLMGWALALVNWDEVAKALIEDAAEIPA